MDRSLQEIYAQIWDEQAQNIRTFCHSRLKGRPDDAEDLFNHAFGLLWEKMVTDGVPPNPKAWLMATVNNLALIQYRNIARNSNNLSAAELNETVCLCFTDEDIAKKIEREEINADLYKAFCEELTDEERMLIKYETVDGIPQVQIAEILGKSVGSTRTQICRLKQKLRRIKREKEKI